MSICLTVDGLAHEWRHRPKHAPTVWGTAIGNYGDCIVDLGTFHQQYGEGGILHYGTDPNIVRFLRAQSFVHRVRAVQAESAEEYRRLYHKMVSADSHNLDIPSVSEIAAKAALPESQVRVTSINQIRINSRVVHQWSGARLPAEAWGEARMLIDTMVPNRRAGYCLLFPYSFASSGFDAHWPHWQQAIEWLLTYTPHTYVLCGMGWEMVGKHPKLVNLLGKTSTMSVVFALAEMADAVVTTSSSLSLYSVVSGPPALVVGNAPLSHPASYFRRWLASPKIRLVMFEQSLSDFIFEGAGLPDIVEEKTNVLPI